MTPEARAQQSIDALLIAAGWAVQDLRQARIVVEAEAEAEFEVDISLRRTLALRLAVQANAFSVNQ